MPATVMTLTKDVWTKVLTGVTVLGSIHIIDQEISPVEYLATYVNNGASAPAVDFEGGIKFDDNFAPSSTVASDYYVKPVGFDGKIVILT